MDEQNPTSASATSVAITADGGEQRTLSIPELTSVLIKHFGVTEGHWEASFNLGIMVGGFQPKPSATALPGAAVVVQGVALRPIDGAPTALSVDASTVK